MGKTLHFVNSAPKVRSHYCTSVTLHFTYNAQREFASVSIIYGQHEVIPFDTHLKVPSLLGTIHYIISPKMKKEITYSKSVL